jgi:hypothetical protein
MILGNAILLGGGEPKSKRFYIFNDGAYQFGGTVVASRTNTGDGGSWSTSIVDRRLRLYGYYSSGNTGPTLGYFTSTKLDLTNYSSLVLEINHYSGTSQGSFGAYNAKGGTATANSAKIVNIISSTGTPQTLTVDISNLVGLYEVGLKWWVGYGNAQTKDMYIDSWYLEP